MIAAATKPPVPANPVAAVGDTVTLLATIENLLGLAGNSAAVDGRVRERLEQLQGRVRVEKELLTTRVKFSQRPRPASL
jgi:hypothetical protein